MNQNIYLGNSEISSINRESSRADIYKNMAYLSMRFIEDTTIPAGAKKSFQGLVEHIRKHKNLQEYTGPSFEVVLIWAFGENEGKIHLEKIGKHATKADIIKGRLLFQLGDTPGTDTIRQIIGLGEDNNTGNIITMLLTLHKKHRKFEYIALVESIIEDSPLEGVVNTLIFYEGQLYSMFDLAKKFKEEEYRSYAYGDYERILELLTDRGAKTTEEIQSELNEIIPKKSRVYGKPTDFGDSSTNPKTSSGVSIYA